MRKLLSILILLVSFTSCNLAGGNDKYSIQGTVKNHTSKSVVLEKLELKQVTAVDSTTIDDKGAFKLEGVSETGFYRLKLDNQTFFLFLLEPAKYTVEIDPKAQEPMKITGGKQNEEFQVGIKALTNAQREMQQWNMAYQVYGAQHASQDTMMFLQQQLQTAGAKFEAFVRDSSRLAKSPLVALFYVTNGPIDRFPKENLAVAERLEKELPNSSYTKTFRGIYKDYEDQLKKQASAPKPQDVSVGAMAPEIDLKNPDGKSIKLSSLKGKVVLLDFWASWCGPCRMEMPNVVAAYKKYNSKGFTVYSVSLDKDMGAWKNAITNLGMIWENHVSDLKWWQSEAAAVYGVQGIPAAFLVDKDGKIIATDNLRGAALDQKLAELLK
jgi:thiol-disulfide isomerase/thioredoxin